MQVRITNKGRSPRGIHDSTGHRIVTIVPGETREMDLTEAQVMRYREKISNGDLLELVEPLAAGATPKPVVTSVQSGNKRGRKPKVSAAPAPAAPAPADDKEALQAEAAALGIAGYQNFGTKRLQREIAAKKAERQE